MEVLRAALYALAHEPAPHAEPKKEEKKEKKPEDQVPLFWKLCSAALVSVSALVVVTLYNQLNATAGQLRTENAFLRTELSQLRTDLVSKDDYNTRIEQIAFGIKEIQAANKTATDSGRERLQEQKAVISDLRAQIKDLERQLLLMHEQMATMEQRGPASKK